jgi:hypothetical protein
MSTAEQRQEWRELAGRLSYFGVESGACDAITALLADVDRLTGDNAALSEALDTRPSATPWPRSWRRCGRKLNA